MSTTGSPKSILLIGASRGLGLAMAEEYLKRGWRVIATVRGKGQTALHELLDKPEGRLEIETLDICEPDQITALRARLSARMFDILFVNAGVANAVGEKVGDVSTREFIRVMVTNALSPLRVIEALHDRVGANGLIGVMSSGLGSVANNTSGAWEVYRASKAALNTLMRSFAARDANDKRVMALIAPGWVRTDMGGPGARLSVEESIPNVVNVLTSLEGKRGLHYLDYQGQTVPW